MQTFTEDELKAVIGHEIAHLVHGDTMASIYAIVGNGILSVFVLIARLFLLLLIGFRVHLLENTVFFPH